MLGFGEILGVLGLDQGVAEQISKLAAGGPRISNLILRSALGKPVIGDF